MYWKCGVTLLASCPKIVEINYIHVIKRTCSRLQPPVCSSEGEKDSLWNTHRLRFVARAHPFDQEPLASDWYVRPLASRQTTIETR